MPRLWSIRKNLSKLRALAWRQVNSEFVGVKNPVQHLQSVLHPKILCASKKGEKSKRIRREGFYGTSQLALVLKETCLDQNTIIDLKPHKEKDRRRPRVYQARFRSLTGSASSPGQGQWYHRHRRRLVCVHDLAGSTSSSNQHRRHRRLRRSPADVSNLVGSSPSPYQRQATGDNTVAGHVFAI